MGNTPTRDFIGYGSNPPDPKWPKGARLALQFVINYEEGSEYSILDGDSASEMAAAELPTISMEDGRRNLAMESMYEYGSRVGIWRLLGLFKDFDIKPTIFGCALALERNPPVAEAVKAAELDICCHGWRWEEHFRLTEEQERRQIGKAVQSITKMTGERPLGWYCRYGPSENTRRLIVEEGGFLYDSDAYNDELPYWTVVGEKPHLIVPYTLDANDAKFLGGALGTGEDFYQYLKENFDRQYQEGETSPKMMSVGLHARIAGRPGRAAGLAKFLKYVSGFQDIWICRRIEIARHWIENFPYPGQHS